MRRIAGHAVSVAVIVLGLVCSRLALAVAWDRRVNPPGRGWLRE